MFWQRSGWIGWSESCRDGRGRVAALAAIALIVFEFLPAPYPLSPPDTPEWYKTLADDARPGAVLNLPMNWDRPGYLLYQTEHGKPLSVAYISRDDPRTLTDRAPVLQHFRHLGPDIIAFDLAAQGRQVLADLGVRWVTLDRYKMPGGRERAYTEAAAQAIFGSQQPVYQDERLTAYEVKPPETAVPYLMLGTGWQPYDPQQRHAQLHRQRAADRARRRAGRSNRAGDPGAGQRRAGCAASGRRLCHPGAAPTRHEYDLSCAPGSRTPWCRSHRWRWNGIDN